MKIELPESRVIAEIGKAKAYRGLHAAAASFRNQNSFGFLSDFNQAGL
jgi:hypothetical protein